MNYGKFSELRAIAERYKDQDTSNSRHNVSVGCKDFIELMDRLAELEAAARPVPQVRPKELTSRELEAAIRAVARSMGPACTRHMNEEIHRERCAHFGVRP